MIAVFFGMFIYAVLHSFLAGKSIKSYIRQRYGERAYHGLYRLGYNIIASVSILPILFWIYFRSDTVVWMIPASLQPVLLLIQIAGLIGLALSLLQIDLGRFAGLSQLRAYLTGDPLPLPPEPLQKGGIYSLVRHPLYLFSLMVLWPMPAMTDTLLAFNIMSTVYMVVGSLLEERRLAETFGQEYTDYQARVPWLVPIPRWRRTQDRSHQTLS